MLMPLCFYSVLLTEQRLVVVTRQQEDYTPSSACAFASIRRPRWRAALAVRSPLPPHSSPEPRGI